MARSQIRDARVHETATAVAERGKDLGDKGWSFIKGVYGTVATQVESVAKENGYKLDLGNALWRSHVHEKPSGQYNLPAALAEAPGYAALHHLTTVCKLGRVMSVCNHTARRECTMDSGSVMLCRQPARR